LAEMLAPVRQCRQVAAALQARKHGHTHTARTMNPYCIMRYHHGAAGSTQDATPYLDFKPVGSCTRLAQVGVGGVSEDEVPGAMDEEDEVVKVVPTYCLQRLQGADTR